MIQFGRNPQQEKKKTRKADSVEEGSADIYLGQKQDFILTGGNSLYSYDLGMLCNS